jgi:ABC-type transport system involved in cytochrome c biogenesis permease component
LLEINPYLWRAARSGRKQLLVWMVFVFFAFLFILCSHWFSFNLSEAGVDFFLLVPMGLLLKIWLAVEASRTFSEDRRGGGLELLLSTPLREQQIVRGQLLALWRQFALPAGAVLMANIAFLFIGMRKSANADERDALLGTHLVLGGFLVADLIALSWVGMWQGLIRRKPNRAALMALARILVLPPVISVVVICLMAINPPPTWGGMFATCLSCWILIGLGANIFFGMEAANKLMGQFRAVVSEGVARKQAAEPVPQPAPLPAEAR